MSEDCGHGVGGLLLHGWQHVGVDVLGDLYRTVAQAFAGDLGRYVRQGEHGGAGVAEIVEAHLRQAGFLQGLEEGAPGEFGRRR